MMKQVTLALVAAVTTCCAAAGPPHPNVVLMDGPANDGSGVVVVDGWILTAAHILPVTTADGEPVGEAIEHPFLDLALVPCEGVESWGLRISTEPLEVHEPLSAYGFWLARQLQRTDGYQGEYVGEMSAPAVHGCSGGAVVNERGELVGIIEALDAMRVYDRKSKDGYSMRFGTPVYHMVGYVPMTEDVVGWIIYVTE